MERFVRFVVVGGVALVAGLWAARLSAARTIPWSIGLLLVVLGVVGLAAGIASEVER